MKKIIIPAAFFLALNLSAEPLSLKEAVKEGIANNYLIESKMAQIRGNEADLKKFKNTRLPKLSFDLMYTKSDDPVYSFGTQLRQGTFSMASMATANNPDALQNYNASFQIGVPLFTGFKISNAVKIGKIEINKSKNEYKRAKAGISFKIIYQWMTVLLRQKLLSLANAAIVSSENEMKSAKMLKAKGMVLGSDYFAAQAILGKLRTFQIQWKIALKAERGKLNILLGKEPEKKIEINGDFYQGPFPAINIAATVATAQKTRTDLKAIKAYKKMAEVFVSMEKNSLLPDVGAFASMERNSETLSNPGSSYIYGLKLSFPVGDATYFAKKDSAKAKKNQAAAMYKNYKRQVKTEITTAYDNYLSALNSLESSRETYQKAEISLKLFMPMYRQGRQSIMEVLRAEATLLEVKAAYYSELYKMNLYYAQTMLAAEKLDAESISEISDKFNGGK